MPFSYTASFANQMGDTVRIPVTLDVLTSEMTVHSDVNTNRIMIDSSGTLAVAARNAIIAKMNEFYSQNGGKVIEFHEQSVHFYFNNQVPTVYFLLVEYTYVVGQDNVQKKWTPTYLQISADLQCMTAYPFPLK